MLTCLLLLLLPLASPAVQQPGGEWLEEQHLLGTGVLEHFGQFTDWVGDVDGDGFGDLVIGSPDFDTGDPLRRGKVSVFSGASGQLLWSITADQLTGTYNIGLGVTRAGDMNGDSVPDFAYLARGNVSPYLSIVSGQGFQEILQIVGSNLVSSSWGVKGICGGDDLTGDGVPDMVVSDEAFVNTLAGQGAINLYDGVTGALAWQTVGQVVGQRLGKNIACPGDLDGDGTSDILAYSDIGGGLGAVHAFSGVDGAEMYVIFGGYFDAWMGSGGMSGVGDWDGDGLDDYIVNSFEPSAGFNRGFGIIYRGYDGAEIERWEGPVSGDKFGDRVAGIGDVNGDGFPECAVMAADFMPSGGGEGAVYIFSAKDGALLTRLNGNAETQAFGDPLIGNGMDVTGDGVVDLAIGDFGEQPGGIQSAGAVYIFSFDPYLTATATSISASTGGSVDFNLVFPIMEAGLEYRLLASLDQPGFIQLGGVGIPLVNSRLLQRTAINPPSFFSNSIGILDANAEATATITVPAGAANAYIGRTFKLAAVSIIGVAPSASSGPVYLTLEP